MTDSEHTDQIEYNLTEEYSATREHCLNFNNFCSYGVFFHTH